MRNVPERVKDLVERRYGITKHSRATYEMDHLLPLELGGSNRQANLWPEAAAPRPGRTPWRTSCTQPSARDQEDPHRPLTNRQ